MRTNHFIEALVKNKEWVVEGNWEKQNNRNRAKMYRSDPASVTPLVEQLSTSTAGSVRNICGL